MTEFWTFVITVSGSIFLTIGIITGLIALIAYLRKRKSVWAQAIGWALLILVLCVVLSMYIWVVGIGANG